jgi:predicted metal-dependent phosphoesterase TrpH
MSVLSARDCYSEPVEVYRRAKARGMDLVTFTDHDTIDGCLELLEKEGEFADFFISEEVSVRDPRTGCRFHVGVYGIDEAAHREIQRLRGDAVELSAYLARERIPAALNHLGSSLARERISVEQIIDLASRFPLIETRNAAQRRAPNALAAQLAEVLGDRGRPTGCVGGSDAHALQRIAWAWTEAEASDRSSFLEALRAGRSVPGGVSARLFPMIRDVYGIVGNYYRDVITNRWRHFEPRARRRAAFCAAASLPLHLVALPATATAFKQARVHGSSTRFSRRLTEVAAGRRREAARRSPEKPAEAPPLEGRVGPARWIPRPGSEEV